MSITVNPVQCKSNIMSVLGAELTPMVHSAPGIGKSDIIRSIATEKKLKLIDVRLSQSDPVELNGFPMLVNGVASFVPMDVFPTENTPIPEGMNGWLLFFDELSSAPPAVQAAAYKIILDREVGQHKLNQNVYMVGAGNRAVDKAVVSRMSTAMQSRLVHLEMTVSHKEWLQWAVDKELDHRITSYIRFSPDSLHKFDPSHQDYTFPCPRTYEFLSKIIKDKPLDNMLPLIAGTIGEGMAVQFKGYCDVYKDLPTKEEIVNNPTTAKLNNEGSAMFAISGFIPTFIDENNVDSIMDYVLRFPKEFQNICLRNVIEKNKSLLKSPKVKKWVMHTASTLL